MAKLFEVRGKYNKLYVVAKDFEDLVKTIRNLIEAEEIYLLATETDEVCKLTISEEVKNDTHR